MPTAMPPPVLPALAAVEWMRAEAKKRIGKEGGNLNQLWQSQLNTVEATLRQVESLGSIIQVLNQQSEVAVHSFRALSKIATAAVPLLNAHEHGDNGESDTKGQ